MVAAASAVPCAAAGVEPVAADQAVPADTARYVAVGVDGFEFEVPDACRLDEGAAGCDAVAKASDGSYGVSADVERAAPAGARRLEELARRAARQLHIRGVRVSRLSAGGLCGVCASGELEDRQVSVSLYESAGRRLRLIVTHAPCRAAWARHTAGSVRPAGR